MTNKLRKWSSYLLVPLVLTGCVRFNVKVDSINDSNQRKNPKYILLSGIKGVDVNDLQFKEYAMYVRRALAEKGFTLADDIKQAELAVFLSYGIGEPQAIPYAFSLPIYGQTGGGTTTYNATTFGPGGIANTVGTAYQVPQYGVVGSQSYSGVNFLYFRYMVLEAIDLDKYRRTNAITPVWKTTVTSAGSSGDLRRVLPIMVAGAEPYISTNTGKQVSLTLYEGEDSVLHIKGLQSESITQSPNYQRK